VEIVVFQVHLLADLRDLDAHVDFSAVPT